MLIKCSLSWLAFYDRLLIRDGNFLGRAQVFFFTT